MSCCCCYYKSSSVGHLQVQASIDVINQSWSPDSISFNVLDYIGILVYDGTEALNYVNNFALADAKSAEFPIEVS